MSRINKVDACIIGSGAGGGVVAKDLGEKGLSVVVLEAGRRFTPLEDFTVAAVGDWEIASRNHRSKFSASKIDRITLGNKNSYKPKLVYGVGGGTLRYLANYVRMLPDDFRVYSLDGVAMDWPISYDELAPYYEKVEKELGVSGKSGDPWFPHIKHYTNPPFHYSYAAGVMKKGFDTLGIRLWPTPVARLSRPMEGRPSCIHCGTCDLGCMINAKSSVNVTYIPKAESTGRVEVRPECAAARINVDTGGRAKSVTYFDKDDREQEVNAEIIIVSAGAVQSPRILLNSKSSLFPDGMANSSGMVGRNYMQHIYVSADAVAPERVDSFRGYSGAVSFDLAGTDRKNTFVRGWHVKPKNIKRGLAATAVPTPGWGAYHKNYIKRTFGHLVGVSAAGEQLPDVQNRVEVDHDIVDSYGMPVPRVTYALGKNERMLLKAMEKNIKDILHACNVEKIMPVKFSKPGGDNHNMGTCRMGNDRKTSVVNSFCQSHDVSNLFIIDASCFVTSGTSNPALTIQAIAKRSAEYIIEESRKGNL